MRAMIRAASMSAGCPAAVYVAMTAIPLETGGWRDEWLVADGAAQGDGNRRIYVIFAPGCSISACRVIALDPGTGLPELGEQRTDCQSACNIDGVDASSRRHRSVPRWWRDQPPEEEASMEQVNIIGIDLAKRSFQLHGARADGSVAFRRKVSRERLLYILGAQQRCVVAMEACASAHYWGREILKLGHEVRLVPPIYVKPFVKRQKNDAADAEAICEAAQRPTMRFVAVKGEEQQARGHCQHNGGG